MLHLDKDNELQQTTLINIFIDITTAVLERTFQDLTTNMGLVDEAKPLINMKQESREAPLYSNVYRITPLTVWNRKESAAKP